MAKVHGRSTGTLAGRTPYRVAALARGLALLDCLVARPPSLPLAELALATRLSKPTAFRLLRTLEDAGYVRQDGRKHFSLALKVLSLQDAAIAALDFPRLVQPYLERLRARTNESSSVGVLDGTLVRYVARAAAERIMTTDLHVGSTLPAHAASMGKVLLAALDPRTVRDLYRGVRLRGFTERTITSTDGLLIELARVRVQGYAVNDEELEIGLTSISVPLHDRTGAVIAAMNLSTPTRRVSRKQLLHDYLPLLLETAREAATTIPAGSSLNIRAQQDRISRSNNEPTAAAAYRPKRRSAGARS